jgi:alkanesulfonate monooxygenase SsuD/methylene tetrahydromethanopterin reductase-like flavin-dependent oxidoreductase (luciferase family)
MSTVLVTGFERYGTTPINPAEGVARALDGKTVGDARIVGRVVPSLYWKCVETVKAAIEEVEPRLVILLGEYGGRSMITVERVATNFNDATRYGLADNAGTAPQDEPTVPGGPVAYYATVPLRAMVKAMREAGHLAEMRDFLRALRQLLQGAAVGYREAEIHTRWARRALTLVLAAEGPKTLELGGELADAVLVHTGLTPEILESSIARVREGERRSGRRLGSVGIWAFAKCSVADTREAAIDEIKMGLAASAHHAFSATLEGKSLPPDLHDPVRRLLREYVTAQHERAGATRNAALPDELGLTEYLARRFAVVGDPEDCRREVLALAARGVDVLFLTAIGDDPERILRRLGAEVLAPLRNRTP